MLMIEKEIPFELTEVDLRNKPDWFLAVSPYGKVPVIVDDGQTIYESAIINEYLDEKYISIPMMPEEPVERAKARIWMDYCTNKYLTLSRKLLVDHGNEELQTEKQKKDGPKKDENQTTALDPNQALTLEALTNPDKE